MRSCFSLVILAAFVSQFAAVGTATQPPLYTDHLDLTYVIRPDGVRQPLRTLCDLRARREHTLAGMERVMGPLPRPEKPVPLDMQVREERVTDGLIWRKIAYCTDRGDRRIQAWLLIPLDISSPRAAVLCLHQTTPNGKNSPVGLSDRDSMHLALYLARRGYITLSPDYPSFGEHEFDFGTEEYRSGSMKAIYDNIRALDLLASLEEVDPQKIGCIGHSLGGHNGLFTAAFDERIKVVVTSCGFTRFHKYKGGDLTGWSSPRYMPLVTSQFGNSPDRMPFDFPEVLAAIAPRAVFVVAPMKDDNFDVVGVRETISAVQPLYKLLDAADQLKVIYPDCGHDFDAASREKAFAFLDNSLGHTPASSAR